MPKSVTDETDKSKLFSVSAGSVVSDSLQPHAVKNLKCLPGEKGRKDELGNWDCHIHTTMYKIDN